MGVVRLKKLQLGVVGLFNGCGHFFKDGCGGGCGQAKKASTGCSQPLDGCM